MNRIALALVLVVAVVVLQSTPSSGTQLSRAQAWVNTISGLGINIERSRPTSLTFQGVPLYQSADYANWLKAQGIGYVRSFFGWSPSNDVIGLGRNPVQSDLTPYFQFIELLTNAGIKVRFDFLDVTQVTDYTASGSVLPAWLNTAAHYAATYGFSHPSMICFGAINEPYDDGNDGQTWNPVLVQAYRKLRHWLPAANWTLSMSHNYWNDPNHLDQAVLAPDKNCIYDVHYYPYNQPTYNGDSYVIEEWQNIASNLASWSQANGNVPLLLGEAGLWNGNDQPYGGGPLPPATDWPAAITDMAQGAYQYRPAPWAVADQYDAYAPPLNDVSDPDSTAIWSSDVSAAFIAVNPATGRRSAEDSQPVGNSGNGRAPFWMQFLVEN